MLIACSLAMLMDAAILSRWCPRRSSNRGSSRSWVGSTGVDGGRNPAELDDSSADSGGAIGSVAGGIVASGGFMADGISAAGFTLVFFGRIFVGTLAINK